MIGPSRAVTPDRGFELVTNVLRNARPPLHLLLAAARHEVVLVSLVGVLAFAAIELVVSPIPLFADEIVAIPTVDDVIAIASVDLLFIAASPVDDIIASARAIIADQGGVVARPAVDDVVTSSSE